MSIGTVRNFEGIFAISSEAFSTFPSLTKQRAILK